jgi:hypothetical protein
MARLKLVVATRLHPQPSSFWLRISSNMPSCSEEDHVWNPFANPIRHALSICIFGLRNARVNRHNSRKDCNLEELINQVNRPSISFTQGIRLQLHGFRSQEKVTNPAIDFLSR